jgi:hypothetical protein
MEVEREPRRPGAEPALEPLGRGLAEPAERSDVVRPDEDGVLGHRHRLVATVGALAVLVAAAGASAAPGDASLRYAGPDGWSLA